MSGHQEYIIPALVVISKMTGEITSDEVHARLTEAGLIPEGACAGGPKCASYMGSVMGIAKTQGLLSTTGRQVMIKTGRKTHGTTRRHTVYTRTARALIMPSGRLEEAERFLEEAKAKNAIAKASASDIRSPEREVLDVPQQTH